jgi:gliding motility-associated-like protein
MWAQQNLVPNGSFEDTVNCPDRGTNYYITASKDWLMPTNGSPDYYNACCRDFDPSSHMYLFQVPQNYMGYQAARTGNAYGGYYAALRKDSNSYYEYMSVKLISRLEEDKSYKLTYYLSLADSFYGKPYPLQYVNYSGAYFSQHLYTANNNSIIPYTPQVISDPSVFLSDSTGWQKVEGRFKAKGGEEYLTIGYFVDYDHVTANMVNNGTSLDSIIAAYYYIDDISLEEYIPEIIIPNMFTPNGDGINDLFDFDNETIKVSVLTIYNRWGVPVFQSGSQYSWDGNTVNGSPCHSGTYYYVIQAETDKYKGFLELIR